MEMNSSFWVFPTVLFIGFGYGCATTVNAFNVSFWHFGSATRYIGTGTPGNKLQRGSIVNLRSMEDSNIDDDNDDNQPPISTTIPLTPCNRICRYNANVYDGQVCIGCFRETYEIGAWQGMLPSEKYFALLDANDRLVGLLANGDEHVVDAAITTEDLDRQAEYWKEQAEK